MRRIIFILIASLTFWTAFSCNGKSSYYDTTDALTRYPEVNVVDFSIAGSAVCSWCAKEEIDINALQIEIVPDDDVTKTLAIKMYDGLGPFSFSNLRYRSGVSLTILGRLYYGYSSSAVDASVKVVVPDEDDASVSCVLTFPEFTP